MDTMNPSGSVPGSKFKLLIGLVIVLLVILVIVLDGRRREAEKTLQQLSVRIEQLTGNTQQNREKAQQVVEKVRKHIDIALTPEPTVATIVDVEKLKAQNAFYDKAKNGHFLVVTTTLAILYDPDADIIRNVAPVRIEEAPQQQPAPAPSSQAPTPAP